MRHALLLPAAALMLAVVVVGDTTSPALGSPTGPQLQWRDAPAPIAAHGQTTLHAATLRPRGRAESTDDSGVDAPVRSQVAPECGATSGCPVQIALESTRSTRTPPPTGTPFVAGGGNDPQIAAGKSFVVVTSYSAFWVYEKSGKPAKADANGQKLSYPMYGSQLFATALHDVNSNLNLPAGTTCNPDNPDAAGTFCLHLYDMRVIHDDFRNRFWLFAAGRNWRNYGVDLSTLTGSLTLRAVGFLAVSKTDDPRGGWYIYTFHDVAGSVGACNDPGPPPGPPPPCPLDPSGYRPGDGSDYPSLGISKDYFVQTITGGNRNPYGDHSASNGYDLVNVFDADALASPGGCPKACGWSYVLPKVGLGALQPVVQHDVVPGGWTLMTQLAAPKVLSVYGFRKSEQALDPPLHLATVAVAPVATGPNPAQPPGPATPKPHPLSLGNVGFNVTKAAERNGRVDVAWPDCADWLKKGVCTQAVRLAEFDANAALSGTPQTASPDRLFGFHNVIDEAANDLVAYGNPAVEVNADGDRVLVYTRVGADNGVFPEARYSVWFHNEPDLRPSAVLMKGAAPCGGNESDATDTNAVCNFDTAGISVDPFDKRAVWLAHDFADSNGNGRIAVGKVLGKLTADFQCWFEQPSPVSVNGSATTANVVVVNTGDGAAKLTKVSLFDQATSVSKPQLISSTASPIALGPGEQQVLHLPGPPAKAGATMLSAKLSAPAVEQYDTANDACAMPRSDIMQTGSFLAGATGKQPGSFQIHQAFLGWGQGATFGSPFPVLFDSLTPIPMIHLGTSSALPPAAIAAGKGDAYLVALNQAIGQWGRAIYVRPLAEMNNSGNVWSAFLANGRARGAAYSTSAYRHAFARIAVIVHGGSAVNAKLRALGLPPVAADLAANPFPRVRVLWSPLAGGQPTAQYWPGDAYVDVAGGDIFAERGHAPPWTALDELYRFGVAHHKPFAVPEWGLYGFDDPSFVRRMCDFVKQKGVEAAVFFNGTPGSIFPLAKKPQSLAAYRACIEPRAGAAPSWSLAAAPRATTLALTAQPSSGAAPLTVDLAPAAQLTVPIAHWLVSFGDGAETSGSGKPPATLKHAYTADGAYTATLVVWAGPPFTDAAAQFLETTAVQVGAKTSAPLALIPTPAAGHAPLKVSLQMIAAPNVQSWELLYGDGFETGVQKGAPPHFGGHTYSKAGTYRVVLVVHTATGRVYAVATVTVGA